MNVGVTGPFRKQVAADEMHRRNREPRVVRREVPRDSGAKAVSGRAGASGSSYRHMGEEGPVFAVDARFRKFPVEGLAQPKQGGGPNAHPVHAGGSAPGKGSRAGELGVERGDSPHRVRRRNPAAEVVRGGVTHEAKRDVEALRRHPAHSGNGLPQGSQGAPESLSRL